MPAYLRRAAPAELTPPRSNATTSPPHGRHIVMTWRDNESDIYRFAPHAVNPSGRTDRCEKSQRRLSRNIALPRGGG